MDEGPTPSRWIELLGERNTELLDELGRRTEEERLRPKFLLRLRERWDRELVHLALELCAARERARKKFPRHAELLADVEGMQQASDARCGEHKARRFAEAVSGLPEGVRIFDLCCGIGGDAMAFAQVAPVVLVDRDPDRLAMAAHNVRLLGGEAETLCADVSEFDAAGKLVHLDPSRRYDFHGETRRTHRYRDYQPGPVVIEGILDAALGACVKLGPHVERGELPVRGRELEYLYDTRSRLQAVLWGGVLVREEGRVVETELSRR